MSEIKLFMVGHAHIDPVWLWVWTEGFDEVRSTFRSLLQLLSESEDLVFVASSAAFYRWFEESDPIGFQLLKEFVQRGRWQLVGGMWVEPDCNAPSGESFARHILYAQRYFQSRFGQTATVGFNPDSFGHNGMLPQLLQLGGMDAYVFMRPGQHEKNLPGRLFWWQSDDGSRVLAYQIPFSYSSDAGELDPVIQRLLVDVTEAGDEPRLGFFGVGNHGGGPSRTNLQSLARWRRERPTEILAGGPRQFFDLVLQKERRGQTRLPTVQDDLQHHAPGTYSLMASIKAANRRTEAALLAAEAWSVVADWVTKRGVPTSRFAEAWQKLLFCQFHDILAGTSIAEAYEDVRAMQGYSYAVAREELAQAVAAIAARVDTRPQWLVDVHSTGPVSTGSGVVWLKPEGEAAFSQKEYLRQYGASLLLFSHLNWQRFDPQEVELQWGGDRFTVEDDAGRSLPCQVLAPSSVASGRLRLLVSGTTPALGYRLVRVRAVDMSRAGGKDASPAAAHGLQPVPFKPEARDIVEIDGAAGQVRVVAGQGWVSWKWNPRPPGRQAGGVEHDPGPVQELELLECAPFLQVLKDEGDTWGHGVVGYSDEVGRVEFGPLWLVENGPLRWSVLTVGRWHGSTVNLMLRSFGRPALPPEAAYLELVLDLVWTEPGVVLKLVLPFAFKHDPAPPIWIVEEAFGQRRRPARSSFQGEKPVEEPLLRWVDVTDSRGVGVTVVNDYLGAADLVDGTLRLTLLRTPVFAHHTPAQLTEGRHYEHVDLGKHRFIIRLYPHLASHRVTPFHWAAEMASPCEVVHENLHAGDLPPRYSFLLCEHSEQEGRARGEGGQWILHALKGSEDGEGYVLRWQRVTPAGQAGDDGGTAEQGRDTFESRWFIPALKRQVHVSARPWQIRTLLVPKDPDKPIIPVDLREFPLSEQPSGVGP